MNKSIEKIKNKKYSNLLVWIKTKTPVRQVYF